MRAADILRLLLLAAIWGGSFLFMRIAVPTLGPAAPMAARVLLAAMFLAAIAVASGHPLGWRAHWRHYAVIGLLNSALPFLLFAHAAQTLSVAVLSILNATSPLWGALIAALRRRGKLDRRGQGGLALGLVGVGWLVGFDATALHADAGWAIAAALAAALCYAMASHAAHTAPGVTPFANAHGSMWTASLWLVPASIWLPPHAMPTPSVLGAVLALGVVCTGFAYLLYFRLIRDIGAAQALAVTYLIPLFGALWGWLALGEPVGWNTLAGGVLVVASTMLVTLRPAPAAPPPTESQHA